MRGIGGVNYANVGVNPPWLSLQYGVAAKTEFDLSTVNLQHVRDSSASPTQIMLNSDGEGIYLSKIEAVGCPDDLSALSQKAFRGNLGLQVAGKALSVNGSKSATVELFDMEGRPVFLVKNANGVLSLKNLPSGLYVARVRADSGSVTRRIVLK